MSSSFSLGPSVHTWQAQMDVKDPLPENSERKIWQWRRQNVWAQGVMPLAACWLAVHAAACQQACFALAHLAERHHCLC